MAKSASLTGAMDCFLAGSLNVDILFQQVRKHSCPYGRQPGYDNGPPGRLWPL